MSMHESLLATATPVSDTVPQPASAAVLPDAAQAVAPEAVAAVAEVAEVLGKGGFSEQATLAQLAEFQLTGLLVVFTVLGGLTILCYLLAWILKKVAPNQYHCRTAAEPPPKSQPAPSPAAAAAAPAVHATPAGIHPGLTDEELVCILAAAATEVLGQAVAIVRFRPADSLDWSWSVQGRAGLHSSHML